MTRRLRSCVNLNGNRFELIDASLVVEQVAQEHRPVGDRVETSPGDERGVEVPGGGFRGVLQVDGYAGYKVLAERNAVGLAFCWSHVRRRFYDLAQSGPAPMVAPQA